jgi:hypothetical protein
MTVGEWNNYAHDLHSQCIKSETKGFDRLADNHLGHSLAGADLTRAIPLCDVEREWAVPELLE